MTEEKGAVLGLGPVASSALGCGIIWLTIASMIQYGWLNGFLRVLGLLAGVSFVFGLVAGLREQRRSLVLIFGLLLVAGVWLYLSGSFASMRLLAWDIGSIVLVALLLGALMCIVAALGLDLDHLGSRNPQVFTLVYLVVLFVIAWVTISGIHVLRTRPLVVDPDRFVALAEQESSIVPDHSKGWRNRRIGLALSGGGYRAALFHAGTLHALEQLGVPVTLLSTVSGGSIIGAHYAVGGAPLEFKNAVAEGRFNFKRELLLIHHAPRLILPLRVPGVNIDLFPWSYDRRDVQASLVRRLLLAGGEAQLDVSEHQPRLLINATDLTWGLLVGMTEAGFLFEGPSPGAHFFEKDKRLELSKELDLADRVAISGAFPGAFPAERLKVTVDPIHATGQGARPLTLADGGIADNLGLLGLRAAIPLAGMGNAEVPQNSHESIDDTRMDSSWYVDTLLVSDASAAFEVRSELSLVEIMTRLFDVAGTLGGREECSSDSSTVCFSARLHLAPPESLFAIYDSDEDLAEDRRTRVSFQPYFYPEPILKAWIEAASPSHRLALESALKEFLRASPYHRDTDSPDGHLGPPRCKKSSEPSLARVPPLEECRKMRDAGKSLGQRELGPATCEAAALRELMLDDIREALLVFRGASTLADTFSEQDTEALYRLGQSLVYLEWPRLSQVLLGTETDCRKNQLAPEAALPDRQVRISPG